MSGYFLDYATITSFEIPSVIEPFSLHMGWIIKDIQED
jgi:hypothetical protein